MNKIKEKLIEAKAKRQLGEEAYNNIKAEFLSVYKQLCSSVIDNEDGIDCIAIVDELKNMKNQIWLASLIEFLGGAIGGVAIWRMDLYGIKQTIISLAMGIMMITIAGIKKRGIKREYNELQDEFIMYVNAKKNWGLGIEEESKENDYANIPCIDACNELLNS